MGLINTLLCAKVSIMKLNLIKNDIANDFKPIEKSIIPWDAAENTGLSYYSLLEDFDQIKGVKAGWHFIAPGAVALTFFHQH